MADFPPFPAPYPLLDGRVITFPRGESSFIAAMFTAKTLGIFTQDGPLPKTNLVTNPIWADGDSGWTEELTGTSSQVLFDESNTRLRPDALGTAGIAQQITVTNAGFEHTVRVGANGGNQYRLQIGTAASDGTYVDELSSSDTFSVNFTPPGDFWITVTAAGDTSLEVTLSSVYAWFVEEFDTLAFVTPYLEEELRDLYFVPTPEESTAYVLHENYPPYKLSYDSGTDTYTFVEVIFTSPPAVWTTDNYPSAGAYFQGRLWLASTPDQGQTFWGSRSGEPEDFSVTDPANPVSDDSVEFTLANFGRIEWMIGTKNLLVGTRNGEYIVRGDETLSNIITPDSASVEQQSSYGSKSVQPLQIGDQVFYVSPDGKKVRAMQYEWGADNWLSKDLTFFSEHITESGIRDLAWAQHPDQLLWCILENGTCATLTYERGEDIYGWHKHTTQGYFRDAAAGELYGTSYLLALIQREEGNIFLEIQEPDSYFDSSDETTFADGGMGTYFLGFDQLIGKTVQVLLDNAVHPDVVVDPSGGVTTEIPGSRCQVGLKFTPKMVTLPFDQLIQTGAVQLYKKRYNRLFISFLDSALPIINGIRPPVRTPPTPMNTRQPNEVGLSRSSPVLLGRDTDVLVTIEQDLPLACTVLSISGEMSQEKL